MLSLIISSSVLSSALISLISSHLPAHAVTVTVPDHSHLSHLSSFHLLVHAVAVAVPAHSHRSHLSHLLSSHLPTHAIVVAVPTVTVAIPRRPSQSTSGQCSLFFCSEFFNLGVCYFSLIFLGLVLFCGEKWCCPYVILGKIKKKTFVLE